MLVCEHCRPGLRFRGERGSYYGLFRVEATRNAVCPWGLPVIALRFECVSFLIVQIPPPLLEFGLDARLVNFKDCIAPTCHHIN
jgi:hypothetical protein